MSIMGNISEENIINIVTIVTVFYFTKKGDDKQVYFGTQNDWNETLCTLVSQLGSEVFKKVLHKSNFIVCSPEISAIMDSWAYFRMPVSGSGRVDMKGFYQAGALKDEYAIYIDAYMPANTLCVGHMKKMLGNLENKELEKSIPSYKNITENEDFCYGEIEILNVSTFE